jgi:uncharacterized membrane protein
VTVAIVLLFISLALLVFFADHLAHSLQVDAIMRVAERSTLRVIRYGLSGCGPPVSEVPGWATPVPARRSGYVQVVHVEQLLLIAGRLRVSIRLRVRVGEHVVAGSTLGWVWSARPGLPGPAPDELAAVLDRQVRIGFERTLEQDPGFGLRQLVDAACKALSPAVNDPYTAIQAIEHLSVLYCELARRPVGDHVRELPGSVTVAIPGRSFAGHLALGVGLIRRYGASEPTVSQTLLRLLSSCAGATDDPARRSAIQEQAALIVADAEREVAQPADLAIIYAELETLRDTLGGAPRGPEKQGHSD